MSLRIWGMFCRVVLPGYTWSAAWHRAVRSSGTVVVPYEWSKRPVMQCSRMSAHLADIKCAACRTSCRPMMALTSNALKICACVLETCEPSCTGRPTRLFFMLETYNPQKITGHAVVVLEPSRQGDEIQSHGTRGAPKPSQRVRSHDTCGAPEPSPVRRQDLEL
jgi:hypothetical protein